MYRVIISDKAERALTRLDRPIQIRIVKAIDELAKDPRYKTNIKKLTGSELYRLRIGDYRVIYSEDSRTKIIKIISMGHRKDVYR